MSQLIYATAKSMLRNADKMKSRFADSGLDGDLAYENQLTIEKNNFRRTLELASELHEIYQEVMGQTKENWYFITIRPDTTLITFKEFYDKVRKYCDRKFMRTYTLSFEQKGLGDHELGIGFHAHIVCDTTHRSKGECLRDTKSTFSTCAAPNCIEVKPSRTPTDIITKYLTNYESADNHKWATKEPDNKWRTLNGLKDLYKSGEPWELSVSSPGQTALVYENPLFVIEEIEHGAPRSAALLSAP